MMGTGRVPTGKRPDPLTENHQLIRREARAGPSPIEQIAKIFAMMAPGKRREILCRVAQDLSPRETSRKEKKERQALKKERISHAMKGEGDQTRRSGRIEKDQAVNHAEETQGKNRGRKACERKGEAKVSREMVRAEAPATRKSLLWTLGSTDSAPVFLENKNPVHQLLPTG